MLLDIYAFLLFYAIFFVSILLGISSISSCSSMVLGYSFCNTFPSLKWILLMETIAYVRSVSYFSLYIDLSILALGFTTIQDGNWVGLG